MECRDFEFFVHAYVDGEFDDAESAECEAHLAICADCRRLARHELMFRQQLKASYTSEVAPESLKKRIRLAIVDQAPAEEPLGAELADIATDLVANASKTAGDTAGPMEVPSSSMAVANARTIQAASPQEMDDAPSSPIATVVALHPTPIASPQGEEGAQVDGVPGGVPEDGTQEETASIANDVRANSLSSEPPSADRMTPHVAAEDLMPPRRVVHTRRRRWSQESFAYAVMAAASLALVGTWVVGSWQRSADPSPADAVAEGSAQDLDPEPIVAEAVSWHRRDLPVDVVGPSDKRVKRWFDDKVNFPVRLPRFDRDRSGRVNLLGARLSNVRDRQAAYVVYEANGSKLSVMVFNRGPHIRPIRRTRGAKRRPIYFKNASGYN
ncbi:MAG: zf-HC2 domain-containing protein, partial [Myxococcota bacterium]